MRLRIGDTAMYYPDVQVGCDPTDTEERYKTRPCVIAEVLSPSTESIDRREKLVAYHGLQSLQTYLIVYRDQMRVIEHYRAEEQQWFVSIHGGQHNTIRIPCLDMKLTLEEIYGGLAPLPGD